LPYCSLLKGAVDEGAPFEEAGVEHFALKGEVIEGKTLEAQVPDHIFLLYVF
jgi:hypothetical protein